jgi:hypothetical protein
MGGQLQGKEGLVLAFELVGTGSGKYRDQKQGPGVGQQ